VDSAGLLGWYNSLSLDAAGHPHVTYTGAADELMYARHDGAAWILETLDPASGVGDFNSLVMTPEGPHVAYRDYPGARLSYAYPAPPTAAPPAARAAGPVLEPPHPNPQSGTDGGTTFRFTLPSPGTVTLSVHDVRGRRVTGWEPRAYPAGTHKVTWNSSGAPSGVYWIRLRTDSGAAARARWVILR
jgi:hypothetical protein